MHKTKITMFTKRKTLQRPAGKTQEKRVNFQKKNNNN